MYNFIGVEEERTNLETVEETPLGRHISSSTKEGQTTGATQGQPAVMGNFDHDALPIQVG